jgi:hypothetical protein
VRRPRYSALGSSRGQLIGALDDAIAQYHHAVASLRRVTPAPIAACAAQGLPELPP